MEKRDLRAIPERGDPAVCHIAAAIIGAAVVGGVATAVSSSNAADAQVSAANTANDRLAQQQATVRGDLLPYNQAGQGAAGALAYGLGIPGSEGGSGPPGVGFGDLSAPVTMDQATLENTPGYKFNLAQGLKATQNSASARGLGVSGAALKGAATYATGLADSTYQQQFSNAVTNHTNTFNRLMGLSTLGENAGAQTGAINTQTAANISGNITGAGNAVAAGDVAAGNAFSGAASGIGNYYMMNSLLNGGGGGMYGGGGGSVGAGTMAGAGDVGLMG